MVAHAYNPNTGDIETEGSLALAWLVNLAKRQVPVRNPVSKDKSEVAQQVGALGHKSLT